MSTAPQTQTITRHPKPKGIRPRKPNYNYIHRNLLPVETHPLPVLIPHNPLSLVAIVLSYLTQVLSPPTQPTYNGYLSSATSSIHVTDQETVRKLWEMGFFGRGSLSRSEPTWLENQKKKGATAEENTAQRRNERKQQKLERAKKEQDEISQKLNDEISKEKVLKTNSVNTPDIASILNLADTPQVDSPPEDREAPVKANHDASADGNEQFEGYEEWRKVIDANGLPTPPPTSTSSEEIHPEQRPIKRLQRQKTVRFSPTTEAREFDLSAPIISPIKSPGSTPEVEVVPEVKAPAVVENQEHLNVSLEEAFFLSYSLGVLNVYCDDSDTVLPPSSLLALFRRHSYHPPRSLSVSAESDDPFMLSYAVYHHYRSLGWVVRSGVKFGVDYLLYNRGPAFSHADFSIIVLPSYSHEYWDSTEEHRKYVTQKTKKTWWWLHGINRVQAQVHKQLILCYVDVPPPEKRQEVDIGAELAKYRVRDIAVKRWTPNRSRD